MASVVLERHGVLDHSLRARVAILADRRVAGNHARENQGMEPFGVRLLLAAIVAACSR
ncbi:hypothetical protein [Jiangella rhizosphaerae]|uniref:hypothetical protein n=1 Tax=Jiangella rhizosphaerae TaxID=2293569 RepID=UPI001313F4FE|nr:hypothetical protein [Jiangella rhizosphaerae]